MTRVSKGFPPPEPVSWGGVYVDFARVISAVASSLEENNQPFAVIGGLAMAAYGLARTTLDVDIVTSSKAQDALVDFLEAEGYETLHRSSGYSNHLHPHSDLGRVDVVYVRDHTSRGLFEAVRKVAGPKGSIVPVLSAEHLAAMKIFAMKNDPTRTLAELEDIRFLLTLPDIDRDEIRGYFEKHELGDLYADLERSS
jgi:hypothetical protein